MEVLPETPPFLKEGHLVHFCGGWPTILAGKYFNISRTQTMEYDVHRIIAAGSTTAAMLDVSFEAPPSGGVSYNKISLLPVNSSTLFEILIGIKGTVRAYPRYANRYFDQLEVTQCQPNPADADLADLGFYDLNKTPWYKPRVREYTVLGMEPPHLLLYNPYQNDEKIVLTLLINRCLLVPASAIVTPGVVQSKVAREINYYKDLMW
jgi:hypothetical protein